MDPGYRPQIERLFEPTTQVSYIEASTANDESTKAKQTMLFIHGWTCRAMDFQPLIKSFISKSGNEPRSFIALDLPGHGRTSATACPEPNSKRFAVLVLQFVKALNLESVVLVGHSMGFRVAIGAVAFSYGYPIASEDYPISGDSSGKTFSSTRPILQIAGLIVLDGSNYTVLPKSLPAGSVEILPRVTSSDIVITTLYTMFSPATPEAFQEQAIDHYSSLNKEYMASLRKAHKQFDLDDLEHVATFVGTRRSSRTGMDRPGPVLIIQSTSADAQLRRAMFTDTNERNEFMDWLEQKIPGSKIRVVTKAGHFPHVDRTTECAQYLTEFLDELSGTPMIKGEG